MGPLLPCLLPYKCCFNAAAIVAVPTKGWNGQKRLPPVSGSLKVFEGSYGWLQGNFWIVSRWVAASYATVKDGFVLLLRKNPQNALQSF